MRELGDWRLTHATADERLHEARIPAHELLLLFAAGAHLEGDDEAAEAVGEHQN